MPSSIGSALGSVGSALGGLFGGGGGTPSVPSVPTVDNTGVSSPSPDYFTGGSSTDPNAPVNPLSLGLPAAVGLGPVAAPGALPAETALSSLPGTTDPLTNQPLATSMGDPATQPWYSQLLKSLATPAGAGTALGGIGNLVESIMRWNTMRTLQNPAALASGAQQMYQPMSKALKRAIISPVTAAAQETGQINAPGLYSQSVASALAPYQYQMQMNALKDYIAALEASGGAYPEGGVRPMGGYGGSSADIFGGSSS